MDSRGIPRGSCSQCGCDQYDGGTEGMKCNYCDHPPGKHVNMNTGIASLAPTTRSSFFSSSPFDSSMDTDSTIPSGQSQPLFDLNTGVEQLAYHSTLDQTTSSMLRSPQKAVRPPPITFDLQTAVSSVFGQKRSPHKRPTTAPPPVFRSPAPSQLSRMLRYFLGIFVVSGCIKWWNCYLYSCSSTWPAV